MPLYKRNGIWWVRFTAPNGRRIRQSAGTTDKTAAQEYHDQLKSYYWKVHKLGDIPDVQWQAAVIRWNKEQSHKKSIYNDKSHFRTLHPHLNDMYLADIDRNIIDRFIKFRQGEDVKNATINRSLEVLRAVLNRCTDEWGWLHKAPKIRLLHEPKRRVRWITHDEAETVLNYLPEHTRAMAEFTLHTGLRESNVTGLKWSQINMIRKVAWVHHDESKSNKAFSIPLSSRAIEILVSQIGKHHQYVFTFRKNPIKKASTKAWRNALTKAGIDNFRWHDLRHTWASWHVQNGTPLNTLQELGGWESYEMVRRYAHLSAEHLADYAENAWDTGTKLAQQEESVK